MDKINFKWHTMALSAIFIIAGGVMNLPQNGADEFTFTAFLMSVLCLLPLYFLSCFLSLFFINIENSKSRVKRCIGVVVLTIIAISSCFYTASTFKEIINFASKVILPRTPLFFIVLIFSVAVVYFALKRQENILKFALLSFVLIGITILFFFFAAADKYDLRNIFIFRVPTFKELCKQIKPYILNPVLSVWILPLYFAFVFGEKRTKEGFFGILAGVLLLGVCLLTSVLLFGTNLAGKLEFPYSSAISTVTVGRLFTRLDGFSYFVYFTSSLIKITVCIFIISTSLNRISTITKSTE